MRKLPPFCIHRKNLLLNLTGGAILAFGCCNIHAFSGITEGGVIGLTLLIDHWTGISPAISSLLLNGACFAIGFSTFGKSFLVYSACACVSYSAVYAVCSLFAPIFPALCASQLWSAIVGALFVGVGAGLCVAAGGAQSGDDALAMSISRRTGLPIQLIYFISDMAVLVLSLTYIPLGKILYSLLTVIISGQVIGIVEKLLSGKEKTE